MISERKFSLIDRLSSAIRRDLRADSESAKAWLLYLWDTGQWAKLGAAITAMLIVGYVLRVVILLTVPLGYCACELHGVLKQGSLLSPRRIIEVGCIIIGCSSLITYVRPAEAIAASWLVALPLSALISGEAGQSPASGVSASSSAPSHRLIAPVAAPSAPPAPLKRNRNGEKHRMWPASDWATHEDQEVPLPELSRQAREKANIAKSELQAYRKVSASRGVSQLMMEASMAAAAQPPSRDDALGVTASWAVKIGQAEKRVKEVREICGMSMAVPPEPSRTSDIGRVLFGARLDDNLRVVGAKKWLLAVREQLLKDTAIGVLEDMLGREVIATSFGLVTGMQGFERRETKFADILFGLDSRGNLKSLEVQRAELQRTRMDELGAIGTLALSILQKSWAGGARDGDQLHKVFDLFQTLDQESQFKVLEADDHLDFIVQCQALRSSALRWFAEWRGELESVALDRVLPLQEAELGANARHSETMASRARGMAEREILRNAWALGEGVNGSARIDGKPEIGASASASCESAALVHAPLGPEIEVGDPREVSSYLVSGAKGVEVLAEKAKTAKVSDYPERRGVSGETFAGSIPWWVSESTVGVSAVTLLQEHVLPLLCPEVVEALTPGSGQVSVPRNMPHWQWLAVLFGLRVRTFLIGFLERAVRREADLSAMEFRNYAYAGEVREHHVRDILSGSTLGGRHLLMMSKAKFQQFAAENSFIQAHVLAEASEYCRAEAALANKFKSDMEQIHNRDVDLVKERNLEDIKLYEQAVAVILECIEEYVLMIQKRAMALAVHRQVSLASHQDRDLERQASVLAKGFSKADVERKMDEVAKAQGACAKQSSVSSSTKDTKNS